MHKHQSTNRDSKSAITNVNRGFTLIELLVSIAIIFLLIAAASVALKGVRKSANRTESMQALRQMIQAYVNYATEHEGRLLPGYPDPSTIGPPPGTMIDLHVRNPQNNANMLNSSDTAPYVWRLAKYLDGGWKIMMTDYRSPSLVSRFYDEYNNGVFGPGTATGTQLGIATFPAYGLNSIFLGGDSLHGGPAVIDRSPWNTLGNKPIAALRLSDAKAPEKVIVFAPTERNDYQSLMATKATNVTLGDAELRPPWGVFDRSNGSIGAPQWVIDPATNQYDSSVGGDFSQGGGFPTDRLGDDKILLSHLDGSVDAQKREDIAAINGMSPEAQLRIMSFWSPFALSNN